MIIFFISYLPAFIFRPSIKGVTQNRLAFLQFKYQMEQEKNHLIWRLLLIFLILYIIDVIASDLLDAVWFTLTNDKLKDL